MCFPLWVSGQENRDDTRLLFAPMESAPRLQMEAHSICLDIEKLYIKLLLLNKNYSALPPRKVHFHGELEARFE